MRTWVFILLATMSFLGSDNSAGAGILLPPFLQPRGLTVENPRCEYRVDPLGVGTTQPRLSWTVASSRRGQVQTA
jgi:hypothetical protein